MMGSHQENYNRENYSSCFFKFIFKQLKSCYEVGAVAGSLSLSVLKQGRLSAKTVLRQISQKQLWSEEKCLGDKTKKHSQSKVILSL